MNESGFGNLQYVKCAGRDDPGAKSTASPLVIQGLRDRDEVNM